MSISSEQHLGGGMT